MNRKNYAKYQKIRYMADKRMTKVYRRNDF